MRNQLLTNRLRPGAVRRGVDGRDKPGHDDDAASRFIKARNLAHTGTSPAVTVGA